MYRPGYRAAVSSRSRPDPGHVAVQHPPGTVRRVAVPQQVAEPVDGYQPLAFEQQDGQQCALPAA